MLRFLPLLLITLSFEALGELPKKRSMVELKQLWTNSPFTTKPEVIKADVKNELEDWTLAGVSANPLGG